MSSLSSFLPSRFIHLHFVVVSSSNPIPTLHLVSFGSGSFPSGSRVRIGHSARCHERFKHVLLVSACRIEIGTKTRSTLHHNC